MYLEEQLIKAVKSDNLVEVQRLVSEGADVNTEDVLLEAVARNNIDLVEYLLDSGADPNADNGNILLEALYEQNFNIIKRLVKYGADVNAQNGMVFRVAIFSEDVKIVSYFINNGADFGLIEGGLASLAPFINAEVLEYLVGKGFDLDLDDTDLFLSVIKKGSESIVRLFIENGIDVNVKNGEPLITALDTRNTELAKYLIRSGADVNVREGIALIKAVQYHSIELVKLLIQHGTDVNARGGEIIEYATEKCNIELLKLLIESGLDVNSKNGAALSWASSANKISFAKYLIEKGADVNLGLALSYAISNSSTELVKLLVENGANITKVNPIYLRNVISGNNTELAEYLIEKGMSVISDYLIIASKNNNIELVKLLIQYGVDVNVQAGNALRVAVLNKNIELVELLIANGADKSVIPLTKQYELGIITREEFEDTQFESKISPYSLKNFKEVYNTLPNELLYKIRSYMQVKGLDTLDIKNVYNPKHPLYKVFGEYAEDKPFLIKNFVFNLQDLNSLLEKESDKYNLSYDIYNQKHQQHLSKENLVIQLNFKEEYLDKIFEIQGPEFKEFYLKLSKTSFMSGHPVLPIPGRTYGWARIYVLDQGWLVNEIQTDWKHLIAFCKQLSTLKPGEEFQGHSIDERISDVLQTVEQREWGKFIGETMLENFDELIMSSILNVARRNSVHHIYMLTPKNQPARNSLAKSMLKDLYHSTPRKFKFHKVVTDLGAGDQEYWYRTASKLFPNKS